jgi:hypothetical protein
VRKGAEAVVEADPGDAALADQVSGGTDDPFAGRPPFRGPRGVGHFTEL